MLISEGDMIENHQMYFINMCAEGKNNRYANILGLMLISKLSHKKKYIFRKVQL